MKQKALKGICAALLAGAAIAPGLLAAENDDFAAQLAQLVAGQDDSAYFSQIRLTAGSREMRADGKTIQLDVPPEMNQGRLTLPLRAVAEAAGAQVSYDAQTQTAVVNGPYGGEIRCPLAGDVIQINGESRQMEVSSYVKEGRTYLSAQALEQALDLEIRQEGAEIVVEAPYQTCRVIAQGEKGPDEAALKQQGLEPKALIADGQGTWVLQFSTPAQARQAIQLLKSQGLEAEPDLYVPPMDGERETNESAQRS